MKQKNFEPIFIIMAGICWGIIGIFSRALSTYGFSPVQITASRCLVAVVFLVIYILVVDRDKLKISIEDIWYFIGTGICSIVFFNICYFITISITTLSLAAVLLYTAPCFVMIMSAVFFGEKITKQKLIALLFAFTGCVLTSGIIGKAQGNVSWLGILTGIGAGFGYALYSIFGRVALKKYNTLTVTVYTFFVACVGIVPFSHISVVFNMLVGNPKIAANVLMIGVLSTMVPFLLYTKGLSKVEAGKASVMAFVEPMVATIVGIVVFQEKMAVSSTTGITLIFISVVLLNVRIGKTK
jgi:drug/metabolite transporter, DME family